jgi:hypothetical protein
MPFAVLIISCGGIRCGSLRHARSRQAGLQKARPWAGGRARLGAGDRIAGPAILTQLDATTLLLPGQTGEVHRFGSLVVHDQ